MNTTDGKPTSKRMNAEIAELGGNYVASGSSFFCITSRGRSSSRSAIGFSRATSLPPVNENMKFFPIDRIYGGCETRSVLT